MRDRVNYEWVAEKRMYVAVYNSRTGEWVEIHDITGSDLGYTLQSEKGKADIYINPEHKMTTGMVREEKMAFRGGVFCHEMLHQIFTDFVHLEKVLNRQTDAQKRKVVQLLANLVEDPAIEHQASLVVGGSMLKALNFTIAVVYQQSPEIQESGDPYSEVCNALIQFGDMGLVKGTFSEEGFKYFKMIAPEFHQQILNPISSERIDAAERWAEMLRPLWEKKSEEELEKNNEDIQKNASAPMQGSGSGMNDPSEEDEQQDDDQNGQDGTSGGSEDKEDKSDESKNEAGNEGNGQSSETDEEDGDTDPAEQLRRAMIDALLNGMDAKGAGTPKEEAEGKAQKFGRLTVTDLEEFSKELRDEMDEFERENTDPAKERTVPMIRMPEYQNDTERLDIVVSADAETRERYQGLKEPMMKDIRRLEKSLRTIFQNDLDEMLRMTSGRYNIKRGLTGESVKVFDKKKERKNIDDMAVMVLVDESGSMRGTRIEQARNTAIILAETFHRLDIPCYVMGFTADMGADAMHMHYVSWKNTATERTSIAKMEAKANNFDGYSVRYAGKLLKMRNAEHKIMFVISDGLPACSHYLGITAGVEDTARAIRETSRFATVMGIGIGGHNELFTKMYNGNFVAAKPEELTQVLIRQLRRIIK